jgi:hypothetical protein
MYCCHRVSTQLRLNIYIYIYHTSISILAVRIFFCLIQYSFTNICIWRCCFKHITHVKIQSLLLKVGHCSSRADLVYFGSLPTTATRPVHLNRSLIRPLDHSYTDACRGSVVSIANRQLAVRSGFRIHEGGIHLFPFHKNVRIGSGVHPASYSMVPRFFHRGKAARVEVNP